SVKYIDRDNHLKLNLLYQDLEIKRIEFFSK
ncbi:membrane protein, partial [Staphylococcus aureus]